MVPLPSLAMVTPSQTQVPLPCSPFRPDRLLRVQGRSGRFKGYPRDRVRPARRLDLSCGQETVVFWSVCMSHHPSVVFKYLDFLSLSLLCPLFHLVQCTTLDTSRRSFFDPLSLLVSLLHVCFSLLAGRVQSPPCCRSTCSPSCPPPPSPPPPLSAPLERTPSPRARCTTLFITRDVKTSTTVGVSTTAIAKGSEKAVRSGTAESASTPDYRDRRLASATSIPTTTGSTTVPTTTVTPTTTELWIRRNVRSSNLDRGASTTANVESPKPSVDLLMRQGASTSRKARRRAFAGPTMGPTMTTTMTTTMMMTRGRATMVRGLDSAEVDHVLTLR